MRAISRDAAGGKVEGASTCDRILKETLCLRIAKEVGLDIQSEMVYVRGSAFTADVSPVVNGLFFCAHNAGTARIADRSKIAFDRWMTLAEASAHPETAPWTRDCLVEADETHVRRDEK